MGPDCWRFVLDFLAPDGRPPDRKQPPAAFTTRGHAILTRDAQIVTRRCDRDDRPESLHPCLSEYVHRRGLSRAESRRPLDVRDVAVPAGIRLVGRADRRAQTLARYTGLSTERLLAALRELDAATFVVFDADEDELLIRTRRNDTLTSGSWKTHKGALTYCLKAVSGRVRAALAVEILTATDQALIRPEVAEYAKEVVAELQRDTCIEAGIEAGTDTAIEWKPKETLDTIQCRCVHETARHETRNARPLDNETLEHETLDSPSADKRPKGRASRERNAREADE